jgi:predicted CxxxxCH...CXXCH cytochrome family protein
MRLLPLVVLAALLGCDDTLYGKPDSSGTSTGESGTPADDTAPVSQDFCGVVSTLNQSCVVCHGATSPQSGLDLSTDPYAALVNRPSTMYSGAVLVVPGDSAASLLYAKISGTQSSSQGGVMPPTGMLPADRIALVKAWIDAGASSECTGPVDTNVTGLYHPDGWADAAAHGMGAKCQADTCTACHGEDLTGGSTGVGCDDCHAEGWRTNCTFCHGGGDNTTGAPPVDIDNLSTGLSFPEHTAHVEQTIHAAWDCTQCHTKPTDVLSVGHFLVGDGTPCEAEVNFAAGLSSAGRYDGAGGCSNLYCHGNGRGSTSTGSVASGANLDCNGCHDASDQGDHLSGEHHKHIEEGLGCNECHSATVSNNTTISNPANHVDGEKDVVLPSGMSRSGGECTGTCHGERHDGRNWD